MGKMVFGYYGFFVTRIIRHTYESLKYENIELVDTNGIDRLFHIHFVEQR